MIRQLRVCFFSLLFKYLTDNKFCWSGYKKKRTTLTQYTYMPFVKVVKIILMTISSQHPQDMTTT